MMAANACAITSLPSSCVDESSDEIRCSIASSSITNSLRSVSRLSPVTTSVGSASSLAMETGRAASRREVMPLLLLLPGDAAALAVSTAGVMAVLAAAAAAAATPPTMTVAMEVVGARGGRAEEWGG